MAHRISQDPRLEVLPNHAGPHYNNIRQILVNTGLTVEQAIQSLNDSWTQTRDERIQAWDQQVLDDDNAAAEAQRLLQEEEQLRLQQEQQNMENERLEAEKKRPKMNDFEEATMVSNYIAPRPSQYALRRLENFEYLEFWYLTQEGCADAAQNQHTQSDDTFGLTKIDDVVALRQVSALRASKNVIPDANLSFRQMSIAKTALIQQMSKFQWPNKAITALAEFFTHLEVHPYRQREFGEQALLTYQARVRQNWHDALKQNSAFNIALFNEDLLQAIYKEVVDKAQVQSLNEVGFLPIILFFSYTYKYPPPPPPLPRYPSTTMSLAMLLLKPFASMSVLCICAMIPLKPIKTLCDPNSYWNPFPNATLFSTLSYTFAKTRPLTLRYFSFLLSSFVDVAPISPKISLRYHYVTRLIHDIPHHKSCITYAHLYYEPTL